MPIPAALAQLISNTKGFLDLAEGEALYAAYCEVAHLGAALEIGSYCGKSTLYLAQAAKEHDGAVFALDHHRGSEEHQPGEGYHDPDLFDAARGRMNSLPRFEQTLEQAGLADWVIPLVAPSARVAAHWRQPLALVFVDGGHAESTAQADYRGWSPWVMPDGVLAIHDVYHDPSAGGQAPRRIWQQAQDSGRYAAITQVGSLGLLRRLPD